MDDQIREALYICAELLLTALIIFMIALVTTMTRNTYNTYQHYRANIDAIEKINELYDYDNKILTGSDVIDSIVSNARMYKFEVYLTDSIMLNISFESENSLDESGDRLGNTIWTLKYLNSKFGEAIYDKFKADLIMQNDELIGIRFIRSGVIL